ncbi:CHAT domain-containing protein [Actinoplanes sp. LDG1-06]|uniref:CHAT domain-containing protein n=1 Tax=Paractinoplanes ovalisporus TaxID=2810368 RepID=A0ABS2AJQ1_9ACTN|nr:CHAT domain-containing protein [Actinoplanes ovalisporus]MBM2619476.1 CHAT domain-containing protein [Actinoplanes ovalisporus]
MIAYAGGTFLAGLQVEVSVGDHARSVDGPRRTATIESLEFVPGEVTLQVSYAGAGDRYLFQILSDHATFSPVPVESLTGQPGAAVNIARDALSRLARGSTTYGTGTAEEWLRQVGMNLWSEMVPAVIKEQFWQLRGTMASLSIASANDVIPWELLYPVSGDNDNGFLVEQIPVMRRVHDQTRSRRVSVSPPHFIVPEKSPGNALDEVAAIGRHVGPSAAGQPIDDLSALLELLRSGDAGLMHFACHNNFRPDGGGSMIELRNGRFVPVMLSEARLRRTFSRRRPLVFINACHSASEVPQYTEMMGWARQFMAAGAGAFLGTLWDVESRSAAAFADAFYSGFTAGSSLGAATLQGRLAAKAERRGDPTWLAYSAYGDPAATASI